MGKLDNAFKGMDQAETVESAAPKPRTTRTPKAAKPEDAQPQPVERGRGRPATGRRSNPEYGRLTVYLPNALRTKAERKWQDTTGSREASDLVEHLLAAYVGD